MRKEKMFQLLRCLLAFVMLLSLLGCRSDGAASAQTDDTGQLQITGTEPEGTEPSETTEPIQAEDPTTEATAATTASTEPTLADTTPTTLPATEPAQTAPPHSHSYFV